MDPLSDVLTLLRPRYLKTGAADVGGAMSVRIGEHDGLFCYAVLDGGCWLVVDGDDPVRLSAGDCVVLASGRSFRVTSDPALPAIDAAALFAGRQNGGVATYGGGGDCFLYAGHFAFERQDGGLLLDVLPPIVHIGGEEARSTLRWSLERIMRELRDPHPGGDLVIAHLAHLVLVEVLRLHLAGQAGAGTGWLSALADHRMAKAIAAVHDEPANRWTVQSLAATAGMSRTAFAVRFGSAVGMAPMAYVTRWRMLLAASAMRQPNARIAQIAFSVGYTSEAAFGTAFRKTMGCSPRRFGRGQTGHGRDAATSMSADHL